MANKPFASLRPFRPGEKIKNPDGSYSTERTITVEDNTGGYMLIPSLWMGPSGHIDLGDAQESARLLALKYEANTGKTFPRFTTIDEAEKYAVKRSTSGGAGSGDLAK